jgi:thiol-disulfide isomerase/thioredoxin
LRQILAMETVDLKSIQTFTYASYRQLVTELLAEGKVTGDVQSQELLDYSKLNQARMDRLQKTLALDETVGQVLNSLKNEYTWVVISEGWCGDAAQLLPIFNLMADNTPNVNLAVVLRDANPELMNRFLTNGARAVPKLIVLDSGNNVRGIWGPRPMGAAQLIAEYKAAKGVIDETAKTQLQMWYLHDKGLSTQRELAELMKSLEN